MLEEQTTEYRALGHILVLVLLYWWGIQLIVFIAMAGYVATNAEVQDVMARNDVNGYWFCAFTTISSFNNAGFTPISDNLMQLQSHYGILIPITVSILFGNTCYPIAIRLLVWSCHKVWPKDPAFKLLLDRPRKCFTHMFNAEQTRVLLAFLTVFNLMPFLTFLGLEYNEGYMAQLSGPLRAMQGWFQAISTRTAGFNTIDISLTSAGMQVMWAWMMYLAAYPLLLTIRKSTDEEERVRMAARLEAEAAALEQEQLERAADLDRLFFDDVEIEVQDVDDGDTQQQQNGGPSANSTVGAYTLGLQQHHGVGLSVAVNGSRRNSVRRDGGGGVPAIGSSARDLGALQQIRRASATQQHVAAQPGLPESRRGSASGLYPLPASAAPRYNEQSDGGGGRRASNGEVAAAAGAGANAHEQRSLTSKPRRAGSSRGGVMFADDYHQQQKQQDSISSGGGAAGAAAGRVTLSQTSQLERQASTSFFDHKYYEAGRPKRRGSGESTLELNIPDPTAKGPTMQQQMKGLVSRDLSMLFIALLCIAIAESPAIRDDHADRMGVWPIFFEIVSGFGTVGLTLGYPASVLSLASVFDDFSKFVMMAVMLAGRHRGLPSSIDPAVFLPALLNRNVTRKSTAMNPVTPVSQAAIQQFGRVLQRAASFSHNAMESVRAARPGSTAHGSALKTQLTMPAGMHAEELARAARGIAADKHGIPRGLFSADKRNDGGAHDQMRKAGGTTLSSSVIVRAQNFRRSLLGVFDGIKELPGGTSNQATRRNSTGAIAPSYDNDGVAGISAGRSIEDSGMQEAASTNAPAAVSIGASRSALAVASVAAQPPRSPAAVQRHAAAVQPSSVSSALIAPQSSNANALGSAGSSAPISRSISATSSLVDAAGSANTGVPSTPQRKSAKEKKKGSSTPAATSKRAAAAAASAIPADAKVAPAASADGACSTAASTAPSVLATPLRSSTATSTAPTTMAENSAAASSPAAPVSPYQTPSNAPVAASSDSAAIAAASAPAAGAGLLADTRASVPRVDDDLDAVTI